MGISFAIISHTTKHHGKTITRSATKVTFVAEAAKIHLAMRGASARKLDNTEAERLPYRSMHGITKTLAKAL